MTAAQLAVWSAQLAVRSGQLAAVAAVLNTRELSERAQKPLFSIIDHGHSWSEKLSKMCPLVAICQKVSHRVQKPLLTTDSFDISLVQVVEHTTNANIHRCRQFSIAKVHFTV